MSIKEIENYLKETLNIKDIKCVSRLLKKNAVFKAVIDNKEYAIKVYVNSDNIERQIKEEKLYKLLNKNNTLNTPYIKEVLNSKYGPIMIIEWINGISIKNLLKTTSIDKSLPYIESMLKDMNNIWNLNTNEFTFLIIDEFGIDKRLSNELTNIKESIVSKKENYDFTDLFSLYDELLMSAFPTFNTVINSDISAHEYIISKDKSYWIDFERFTLGDPNNDLARSFVSLTNGIYKEKENVDKIYELFKFQERYNKDTFLYYIIEKIMCSIYDAPEQISNDEIDFYYTFVKEKKDEKIKQLLK